MPARLTPSALPRLSPPTLAPHPPLPPPHPLPPRPPARPALDLLFTLCALPTAPGLEHSVVHFIHRFAARHRLTLRSDRWGNLLLASPAAGSSRRNARPHRRLVLAAHLDHPALVSIPSPRSNLLHAELRGGVATDYLLSGGPRGRPARITFHTPAGPVPATVLSVDKTAPSAFPIITLRPADPISAIPPGCPGVFTFPHAARFQRNLFHARACDDLAGVAAALAALLHARKTAPTSDVAVLLTRCEEVGFIGALAAATDKPKLLSESHDNLIAIECSAAQPYAPIGQGVVIRVGDKTSIFNSSLTAHLTTTAQRRAETPSRPSSTPPFQYQRALMPGGTCESTVYDAFGYHAAAVCIPLGNYHNMNRSTLRLAPEFVSVADFLSLTTLLADLAHTNPSYQPGHRPLKQRLTTRFRQHRHLLA